MIDNFVIVEFDRRRFDQSAANFDKIIHNGLKKFGDKLVAWMVENSPKDTTLHAESIRSDIDPIGDGAYQLTVSSSAPGARWALEEARGPGEPPPFAKILGWVNRRQIAATGAGSKIVGVKRFESGPRNRKKTQGVVNKGGLTGIKGAGYRAGAVGRIQKVGADIGRSYRNRKVPRDVDKKISMITKEFSFTTAAEIQATWKIMGAIAHRGVKATNKEVFTKAVTDVEAKRLLAEAVDDIENELRRRM